MRWGRLHAGVDIAVPAGTPVRASKSGTVQIAGWVGGYGNYTCIGHGGGLSTCYGAPVEHRDLGRRARVAGPGHRLRRAAPATASAPHVHFETRINGAPVNPAGYL